MVVLKNKGLVICIAGLLALVVVAAWLVYIPPGASDSPPREFVIQEGDGLSKVARLLAEENLVRSRYPFLLYAVAVGEEKGLQAGKYLLSENMSMAEVVRILSEGLAEHDDLVVTIPEGFNAWEIDQRLAETGLIKAGDFFAKAQALEGQLFPDTYRLKKNQESGVMNQGEELIKELLGKMRENFEEKAGKISREQLIVASMLEKEVQKQEDMALVAGIIYRRLELGMLLQIDASVAYGACLQQMQSDNAKLKNFRKDLENEAFLSWGCDVTEVNLIKWIKIDGPYNTYMRSGLPVGPISNPGYKAINAALLPQSSDYLYYLSARDGQTVFSKTAGEHERNRAKYLR